MGMRSDGRRTLRRLRLMTTFVTVWPARAGWHTTQRKTQHGAHQQMGFNGTVLRRCTLTNVTPRILPKVAELCLIFSQAMYNIQPALKATLKHLANARCHPLLVASAKTFSAPNSTSTTSSRWSTSTRCLNAIQLTETICERSATNVAWAWKQRSGGSRLIRNLMSPTGHIFTRARLTSACRNSLETATSIYISRAPTSLSA